MKCLMPNVYNIHCMLYTLDNGHYTFHLQQSSELHITQCAVCYVQSHLSDKLFRSSKLIRKNQSEPFGNLNTKKLPHFLARSLFNYLTV